MPDAPDAAAAPAAAAPAPLRASVVRRCDELVAAALRDSPRIHVLLAKMAERGCAAAAAPVACADVFGGAPVGAGYDAGAQRVVVNPRVPAGRLNAGEVTRALAHELVHAYDACRAVVDAGDCAHLACTEIRAANLSGDCDFFVEAQRMPLRLAAAPLAARQQACVRRRAELSVAMHAACGGGADAGRAAARAVAAAWAPCYADAAPFASN